MFSKVLFFYCPRFSSADGRDLISTTDVLHRFICRRGIRSLQLTESSGREGHLVKIQIRTLSIPMQRV